MPKHLTLYCSHRDFIKLSVNQVEDGFRKPVKIYYYLIPSQFPQKTPDQKCLDLTNFTTNYTIDRENPLDSDLGMAKNVILVTAINRFGE